MAQAKQPEHPTIADIDQTCRLLEVTYRTQGDAAMRATHSAARAALAKSNATIQEAYDKAH